MILITQAINQARFGMAVRVATRSEKAKRNREHGFEYNGVRYIANNFIPNAYQGGDAVKLDSCLASLNMPEYRRVPVLKAAYQRQYDEAKTTVLKAANVIQ